MTEFIEIVAQCPNPKCKAGMEHLRIRELIDMETGRVIQWHQRCTKCNTHFTQKWRWIEVVGSYEDKVAQV